MKIDSAIRAQITQMHVPTYTIEPSLGFTKRVMDRAFEYEKQRRARITLWFGIVAIAPYAVRQGWMLIRHDWISVSSLPFANAISQAYTAFLSSFASYAFIAAGLILAFFVVGLPKWNLVELKKTNKAL